MIGWSWVLLTGVWLDAAGTFGTLIAFSVGGLAIALIGLTYAELAAAMPEAGGEHVYTRRALGPRWSFVCTWSLLFAYLNVCLFESVALPTAIEYLAPAIRVGTLWSVLGADVDLGFVVVGWFAATVVTGVNYVGIRAAALLQAVVTGVIVFSGLLLITGAGLYGDASHAEPWIAVPASGILTVLIMVPAMLMGFDVIPQSAEEIDLPPESIGRLLVVSLLFAVAWYVLISAAVAFAIPSADLAGAQMATADAARNLWHGRWAGDVLVLGGIGGILTSWNAFIIGASRVLYVLAESGWVPAALARTHPKYRTPHIGILAVGAGCMAAPLFGKTILVWLVNTSSFAVTLAFFFVALSFLVLRRREPDMPRPFRVRHPKLVGYGAALLSIALLSAFFPWAESRLEWPAEWLTIGAWAILGAAILLRRGISGRSATGRDHGTIESS